MHARERIELAVLGIATTLGLPLAALGQDFLRTVAAIAVSVPALILLARAQAGWRYLHALHAPTRTY